MGSLENWLIEGGQDADADIRSDTIQDLKRDMATKGCCRDVVKEITHTYWMVSNQHWAGALVLFGPGLGGYIPPFSWILVLVVGLTLPIIDVIGPEDVLDLVGDHILCSITDSLVHRNVSADIGLQCIDKLFTVFILFVRWLYTTIQLDFGSGGRAHTANH